MVLVNSMSDVWIIFGTIFVLFWIRFLWRRRRLYILSAKVPGPLGFPLIGSAHLLIGTSEEIYRTVMGLFDLYPDLGKAWFGLDLFYLVTKPEYFEKILNHPGALNRSFVYKPVGTLIGDGIILGDSDRWKIIRKYLAPSFNQVLLNQFVPCFVENSRKFVEILTEHCRVKDDYDIYTIINNCFIDITCETLFDYQLNTQERKLLVGNRLENFLELVVAQSSRVWNHIDVIYKRTKLYKVMSRAVDEINETRTEIFEAKNGQFLLDSKFLTENQKTQSSLIQNLFTLKSKDSTFTDEFILTELNTFLIAGGDTAATTICFSLLLLGMHPELQEELYSEIEDVIGNRDSSNIELEDLQFLKYTERVLQETMRLFPVVPALVRQIDSDLQLDDGVTLPRGSHALLGIISLHRNAKYWPEPLKFDPNRFLSENMSKRHPNTWIPFSAGPRNCIGTKHGMMSMKVLLATVVRNFEIFTSYKTVEEVEVKFSVMTRPIHGYKLSFKPRQ